MFFKSFNIGLCVNVYDVSVDVVGGFINIILLSNC